MIHPDLIKRVIQVLESLGIPYMITGSVASSGLGEPRMTHDLDVVVEIDGGHVAALVGAFPDPDYYLSEDAIREAVLHGGMFNLIDNNGVGKVDFWLLKDDPLDERAFLRRTRVPVLGVDTWLPRPEDLILLKLRWAKMSGGSEKQMGDCKGILALCKAQINLAETEHWALRFGLRELWMEVCSMAGIKGS